MVAAEKLGVVMVVMLLGIAILGGPPRVSPRTHGAVVLGTLLLTPLLLMVDIWNTSQVRHLRGHPSLAAAGILVGLLLVGALAVLFARRPQTLPVLAVAALPFRLPISTGGASSSLLIPLYLVVAGGVIAELVPELLGRVGLETSNVEAAAGERARERLRERIGSPRGLEVLLVASVLLYGLQACYSEDFPKALENVVFFYVPFGLLFTLLRKVHWTRGTLLACFASVVALAIVFAGVGFVEYHRRELFLNPKVVAANEYDNYFRVNSLFFDPNIYGRFLALVMLAVTTAVLWGSRRRGLLLGAGVLLWLWGGLITSFSQSSIAALLLGLAVLAAWRWDMRSTVYVSLALSAIGLVVFFTAPPGLHIGLAGKKGSASNATSGRTKLIEGGIKLFVDRPVEGFGPGSFPLEYRSHERVPTGNATATSASHTIPVTVAAEQGVLGLALYLLLLISAFLVLFRGAGRSPPRVAIAACFAALVLHTWAYADFLEDPVTWTLLGIGVALAMREPRPDLGGNRASSREGGAASPATARV